MDVLESFSKKLEHEIRIEKQKLLELEKEIARLKIRERKLKEKYALLEKSEFNDIFTIHMKSSSMGNILKELKNIKILLKELEKKAEEIRVIIKGKNAEKKAIKNYQKKLENERNIEELKKETQLIDEIFNRNR